MTKKKRRKKRSVPPKKRIYIPPPLEKAEASILAKVIFILCFLLFLLAISILVMKTGRYPRGGYDSYPGQPWDID